MRERVWGDLETNPVLYETSEEVPPAPSLDEIQALLADHQHRPVTPEDEGNFALHFDGEITTDAGVTAQNLVETLEWQGAPPDPGRTTGDALLQRLLAARPDLRERAAALCLRAAEAAPSPRDLIEPLFLHGYAWEKTAAYIGAYGDLDQLLAWKFLEADLAIGHEFTHQLVPALADDIWLHARITAVGAVRTPAGRFRKAVTCLYAVDYRVTLVGTQEEPPIGYARVIDYGTISYAPEVGPVAAYERKFVAVGDELALGPGFGELELSLTESSESPLVELPAR